MAATTNASKSRSQGPRAGKLRYYVGAVLRLLGELENPGVLFRIALRRAGVLRLKSSISLELLAPIDVLVLVETLIDDEYRLIGSNCRGTIVDAGAGIGEFSVAAARRYPMLSIHAIEPDPVQCELLRRNLRRNRIANVTVHECALGSASQGYLQSHPHRVKMRLSADPGEALPVPVVTLRDIVPDQIGFLKIDCEGAELDILSTLAPEDLRAVERISLEYHDNLSPGASGKIQTHLESHGFEVERRPRQYDTGVGLMYAHPVAGDRC